MGKTYGRTHYWIWNSGYLHRVRCLPAERTKDGVEYQLFIFKEKPNHGMFYIQVEALAKTKAQAYSMDISSREFPYERM